MLLNVAFHRFLQFFADIEVEAWAGSRTVGGLGAPHRS